MKTNTRVSAPDPENEARSVAEYLGEHVGFFEQHLDLLQQLRVPHATGGAVSLVERQIQALRDENQQLRAKLNEFVQVAEDNHALTARLHQLTLAILEARDLEDLIRILKHSVVESFGADFVVLRLIPDLPNLDLDPLQELVAGDHPGLAAFEHFFGLGQPLFGRLREDQGEFLFGAGAAEVASAALIPLPGGEDLRGILAIGSRDTARFQPGKDSGFLEQLGELVGRAMVRHLRQQDGFGTL